LHCNLGGVCLERKEHARAEELFREALAIYAQTLPAGNLNEGITRIKLGRMLLRERRLAEVEVQSLTGYQIPSKQASPRVTWLQNARADLVSIYAALREPEKAQKFRAEHSVLARN
jgi:serine/threonine-protein kinase